MRCSFSTLLAMALLGLAGATGTASAVPGPLFTLDDEVGDASGVTDIVRVTATSDPGANTSIEYVLAEATYASVAATNGDVPIDTNLDRIADYRIVDHGVVGAYLQRGDQRLDLATCPISAPSGTPIGALHYTFPSRCIGSPRSFGLAIESRNPADGSQDRLPSIASLWAGPVGTGTSAPPIVAPPPPAVTPPPTPPVAIVRRTVTIGIKEAAGIYTFSGVINPVRPGVQVTLARLDGPTKRVTGVASVRTDVSGRYTIRTRLPAGMAGFYALTSEGARSRLYGLDVPVPPKPAGRVTVAPIEFDQFEGLWFVRGNIGPCIDGKVVTVNKLVSGRRVPVGRTTVECSLDYPGATHWMGMMSFARPGTYTIVATTAADGRVAAGASAPRQVTVPPSLSAQVESFIPLGG